MYNQLLFYCPRERLDVIFMSVSNQCPQGPPFRESSHLNVAVSSPRPKARARFRYFEPEEKYFAVTHQLGEQSLKER
jgi:hypothetical protein